MKNLWAWAFAVSLLSGAPVQAAGMQAAGPGLDFHGLEHANVQTEDGYAALRRAVPSGADAQEGVARLRQAGARCGAAHNGTVDCFYRERISVDDVVDTYAIWDVRLSLNAGKVADMAIARSVEQN